jgi:c-type cytochrome biogenesis protein CcmF
MKYPGDKWIHITRRWTMVTWAFLSLGIPLGAHWAYYVLGWGGYWGWDPVENASLMPWLIGTAFLHSVMMQEKRGMLKVWNMWLVFATFWLSILGTYLTRSGVLNSVHAFAQSPIGDWFKWFLVIIFLVFAGFFFKNKSYLTSEHKLESLISRESSFLFNNLLFVLACFTVLWGTWFPLISDLLQGHKVTVGPPFFNSVIVPVALLLLLLTAVGPLLAWRKTSLDSLKRNFLWPALGALAVGVLMVIAEVLARYLLLLCFDDGNARHARGIDSHLRVYTRRPRHFSAYWSEPCRLDAAFVPSQHPPLRRIHRSFRRGLAVHRSAGRGIQPRCREGNGIRRQADHRSQHSRQPFVHARGKSEPQRRRRYR